MKVKALDYHRNGVCGLGFYVGIVNDGGCDRLVIRAPKEYDKDVGQILCFAFDLAMLDKRNIKFGENSFRGDYYNAVMDEAIEVYERELPKRMAATAKAMDKSLKKISEQGKKKAIGPR